MNDFSGLGAMSRNLYLDLKQIYFLLLPVFLFIAIIVVWVQGKGDFSDKIKRVFISTLLLIGFPEITESILAITSGLADKIDDMSGIENIMKIAGDKISKYQKPSFKSLLIFGDLLMSILSYLSYLILYCARFIMVAIYHFSWAFLTVLSPIILLFHVFSSSMTVNLFKSLIEIASWKVVWAILSLMLKALPWGETMQLEGNYLTLIVINFVIALCMIGTPMVVKSIVGSGFTSFTSTLTPVVAMTMVSVKAKAMSLAGAGKRILRR